MPWGGDTEDPDTHVDYLDNTAIISRMGPYGHYFIRLKRGASPKSFAGAFTSIDQATKVIKAQEALRLAEKEKNGSPAV